MDFFAMDPMLYQCYIHAAHTFIKENGLAHEGVFHNALETISALWERFTTLQEIKIELSHEETELILQAYRKSDAVFSERYARIFERCIGDPVLRSDMEYWLGGVHTWAKAVTDTPEAIFDRIYRETEGLSHTLSCKAFDEVIRTESETLSQLVDRCYEALYK